MTHPHPTSPIKGEEFEERSSWRGEFFTLGISFFSPPSMGGDWGRVKNP